MTPAERLELRALARALDLQVRTISPTLWPLCLPGVALLQAAGLDFDAPGHVSTGVACVDCARGKTQRRPRHVCSCAVHLVFKHARRRGLPLPARQEAA